MQACGPRGPGDQWRLRWKVCPARPARDCRPARHL